ncbi:MAG: hypothetical protein HYV95_16055 [Opitutae bacterium]|nr:hypothetical protein [Opitutae bacterium]
MNQIDDTTLSTISGGDSFWKDLGQFIGGCISGFGTIPDTPGVPLSGTITAGLVAAAIN